MDYIYHLSSREVNLVLGSQTSAWQSVEIEASQQRTVTAPISYDLNQEWDLMNQWRECQYGPLGISSQGPNLISVLSGTGRTNNLEDVGPTSANFSLGENRASNSNSKLQEGQTSKTNKEELTKGGRKGSRKSKSKETCNSSTRVSSSDDGKSDDEDEAETSWIVRKALSLRCVFNKMNMNIISWNVRGIGGSGKFVAIHNLVLKRNPALMGLMEMKHSNLTMQKVRKWWGNGAFSLVDVPAISGSWGLILIWDRNKFQEENLRKGNRWIWVKGKLTEKDIIVSFTLVFGPNDRENRKEVWEEIIDLKQHSNHPMMVLGDFNEIVIPSQRKGCSVVSTGMRVSSVERNIEFDRFAITR